MYKYLEATNTGSRAHWSRKQPLGMGVSILKYQYIDTDASTESFNTQIKNIETTVFYLPVNKKL